MSENKHLTGLKIVLTGDFDAHERDEATRLLEALGADVTGSVSGKTMAVVVGKDAGAKKLTAAKERGLPLLNEAQLLELIAGKTLADVVGGAAVDAAPAAPAAPRKATKKAAAKKATPAKTPSTPSTSTPSTPSTPTPMPPMPFAPAPPKDGAWIERFDDGGVHVEGAYKDGLRHGSWKVYWPNRQLREDYAWERGVKHGPELDWTEAGVKICDGVNHGGKRRGHWQWWHANGRPAYSYDYDDDGRMQGKHEWDLEDGTPRARGQFLDNERHGAWTWWREGDHERLERGHHRGSFHGREAAWFVGGQLAFQRSWHFGQRHGDEEIFDKAGKPMFKGTWHRGFAVGTHSTWDNGTEKRVAFVDGLPPELVNNAKQREQTKKKLAKAKDSYKKRDVLQEVAGYGHEAPFLLSLWRAGDVDVAADPELWEVLAAAAPLMTGADVARLLTTAKPDKDRHAPLFAGWANDLDRIVLDVYARDAGPIDACVDDLPPPFRLGVDLVRARFGHDVGKRLHKGMPLFVAKHMEYGGDEILWPEDGRVVSRRLRKDHAGEPTPLFFQVIEWFGGLDRFVDGVRAAALKEADEAVSRVPFTKCRELIARATPQEMITLLKGISLDNGTESLARDALVHWRTDDIATTAAIALGIDETGLRKWPAVCVAILRYADAGQPIPDALVDALPLAEESPTYTSSWSTDALNGLDERERKNPRYRAARLPRAPGFAASRMELVQRAMAALTDAQRRRVIERHLTAQYGKGIVAQYLHLVDDPALWDRAIEIAAAERNAHDHRTMYGLGELGARVVPRLITRLDAEKSKEGKESWGRAILVALARACVDDGGFDAAYDRYVRVDVVAEDYYARFYEPFFERIVHTLPQDRVEAILLAGLSSSKPSRAFRCLCFAPTERVLTAAFSWLLQNEAGLKSEQQNDVGVGIGALPNPSAWVRFVLAAGAGGGITDALKNTVGWQEFEAITKALKEQGAAAPKKVDHIEKVRLRAEREGGRGETIYLLRRADADDAAVDVDDHNVLGGAAPGVDAARWPSFDDEPMEHMFTLDLKTMPALAREYPGMRTISVFVHSPDHNEAYTPGNGQTAVLMSTEAQLAAPAAPPDGAKLEPITRFGVVAVEVDPAVWAGKSELRDELYRCSARVGGGPLWLQDDEGGDAGFVMQFDESFCSMNLGDSGIMYVYADDAFWQCH